MSLHRPIRNYTRSDNSSDRSIPPPLSAPVVSGESNVGHHLVSNIIIGTASAASAVLFLLLTYYTVLIRRRRGSVLPVVGNGGASDQEGGGPDYVAWNIRTVGLDEHTINSIPSKPYFPGSTAAAADCSVCLGNFREGELVRLLPACSHTFHDICIDTWLRAHINCPLCRADVFGPSASADSRESGLGSVARVLEEVEDDGGVDAFDTALDCIESSTLGDRGDLPDNVSKKKRRSNSMGSSLGSILLRETDDEERSEHGKKQGGGFMEDRRRKNPPDVGGGSPSGSGRIFIFSGYGRSRSSSILPI